VAEIVAIDTPSLGNRRYLVHDGAITPLLAAWAVAVAIVAAPSASAAPNVPTCSDGGGSTQCQSTGNVQIYTAPRAMPAPTNSTYGPYPGYRGGRN
jgi:hypothetical protein